MSFKINKIVNDLNNSTNGQSGSNKKTLIQRNRVLDQAARERRKKQQLAQLERDNFHDDPHANLVMHKKAPKFEDTINSSTTGRKSTSSTILKSKFLTLNCLIEEDSKINPNVNYSNAAAPSPDNIYVPVDDIKRKQFNDYFINRSEIKEINDTVMESETSSDSEDYLKDQKETKKKKTENYIKNDYDEKLYKCLLKFSKRHFCCVCGFQSPYTCVNCGMRYCSSNCLKTHKDTRCLKWTA